MAENIDLFHHSFLHYQVILLRVLALIKQALTKLTTSTTSIDRLGSPFSVFSAGDVTTDGGEDNRRRSSLVSASTTSVLIKNCGIGGVGFNGVTCDCASSASFWHIYSPRPLSPN